MMPDSKSHPYRITVAWCDKCRAEIKVVTPREHKPRCCPMCRRKFVVERFRYE